MLGGSLRRAGNRLRITAQLVEARTGTSVWAERYDRELADVFEVQDEIARNITQALRITLTPQEEKLLAAKPTGDPRAYDHYLKGRAYSRRMTRSDLDLALQMFEHAILLDPGFALAHAGIANACGLVYEWHDSDRSWLERGRASCERALALDPSLPEALVARARILYAQKRYDEAVRDVRRAIEMKRDCDGAYNILARSLFESDRWAEAIESVDQRDRGQRRRLQRLRPLHQHLRGPRPHRGRRAAAAARDRRPRAAAQGRAGGRARAHPPRRRLRRHRARRGRGCASCRRRSTCGPTTRTSSTTRPAPTG